MNSECVSCSVSGLWVRARVLLKLLTSLRHKKALATQLTLINERVSNFFSVVQRSAR